MNRIADITPETVTQLDINMSPLIDMVFLLLIFFMVTTVFVEETGVTIQKPHAATADELERNSILIAVTSDGKIIHGGQERGINGVRGLVARLLQERDMPVIILADDSSHTGMVVRVIDECKLAGATSVSLAARKQP